MNRNTILLIVWLAGLILFFVGVWNMSQKDPLTLTVAFICLFAGIGLFTYPLTTLQGKFTFRS
jgi:hypothetical protein